MPDHNICRLPPALLGGFWAMRPDAIPRMIDLARAAATWAPEAAVAVPAPQVANDQSAGVAVIPLTGVLTPYGSWLSVLFGGGSGGVQGFREQLARAVADPSVSAIVLDVDSPGGSVGLVPEAAAEVLAARDVKPVYAVANTQAASGAYYIASQASQVFVTPSGMVGSVGVYYMHEDWSAFNEKAGIDVSYIYAGQYKTEGNADEPLSDAARAAWQADADALYAMFVGDVATGRGVSADTVQADYGQGRVLLARDALAAGMVDGVDTIQSVISQALSEAVTSMGPSARRLGRAGVVRSEPRAEAPTADPALELVEPEPVAEPEPEPAEPSEEPSDEPELEPEPDPAPVSADVRRLLADRALAA